MDRHVYNASCIWQTKIATIIEVVMSLLFWQPLPMDHLSTQNSYDNWR
jgi:hypothetical protein